MKLTNPQLMRDYMKANDFSQARMGRYVGCSRQFIHQLLTGEATTCTPEVGKRIEEALSLLPGTLFVEPSSSQTRQSVKRRKTAAA